MRRAQICRKRCLKCDVEITGAPRIKWCSRECAFVSQVVSNGDGCHLWTGNTNNSGYGLLTFNRQVTVAHRYAYERVHGVIPDGLYACHHCDVRNCCNVNHLFIGTPTDNYADMATKGRAVLPPVCRGVDGGRRKLTSQQVLIIRKSTEKAPVLAARYGVCDTAIHKIRSRQTWRHLP